MKYEKGDWEKVWRFLGRQKNIERQINILKKIVSIIMIFRIQEE